APTRQHTRCTRPPSHHHRSWRALPLSAQSPIASEPQREKRREERPSHQESTCGDTSEDDARLANRATPLLRSATPEKIAPNVRTHCCLVCRRVPEPATASKEMPRATCGMGFLRMSGVKQGLETRRGGRAGRRKNEERRKEVREGRTLLSKARFLVARWGTGVGGEYAVQEEKGAVQPRQRTNEKILVSDRHVSQRRRDVRQDAARDAQSP
ncbi:hypothetical protein DFH07DRAFT_843734, partial [Mycena maculata]